MIPVIFLYLSGTVKKSLKIIFCQTTSTSMTSVLNSPISSTSFELISVTLRIELFRVWVEQMFDLSYKVFSEATIVPWWWLSSCLLFAFYSDSTCSNPSTLVIRKRFVFGPFKRVIR